MLTLQQVSEFERSGLLHLPRTVPAAAVSAMRNRLWGFLSAMHGRRPDDPTTWTAIDGRTHFKTLMRTGAFDDLSGFLSAPVDELLAAWTAPAHWGHPLVTFPGPDRSWSIPARGWHVDSTGWSSGQLPGVVAFTFLDDVRPRGGGTLVMPGSHHLTWQLCLQAGGFMKTSDMKATLAGRHEWFADLWREPIADRQQLCRYLEEGDLIEGTQVRVAELCGRAGDVVLMNQRLFHVTAPNALDSPRMMLSDFLTGSPSSQPLDN